MKKILKAVFKTILNLLLIFGLLISIYTGYQTYKGLTNLVSRNETKENIKFYEKDYDDFKKGKEIDYVSFKSSKFDHDIPANLVTNPSSDDLVIMVHGLGGTRYSM